MHRSALGAMLAIVIFAGCEGQERPPDQPPPPPPPTAAEIANEFQAALQPFRAYMQKDAEVPPQQAVDALNVIRNKNQQHLTSENGDEGRRLAGNSIEQMLRQSYDAEAWAMVLFSFEALNIVAPRSAESFQRQRRYATVQVNRPRVNITGIYVDEARNVPTLFCQVTMPPTGQTERWEAQPGECWKTQVGDQEYEICLDQIIGTGRGAIFTYKQTGEQFEVRIRSER